MPDSDVPDIQLKLDVVRPKILTKLDEARGILKNRLLAFHPNSRSAVSEYAAQVHTLLDEIETELRWLVNKDEHYRNDDQKYLSLAKSFLRGRRKNTGEQP